MGRWEDLRRVGVGKIIIISYEKDYMKNDKGKTGGRDRN